MTETEDATRTARQIATALLADDRAEVQRLLTGAEHPHLVALAACDLVVWTHSAWASAVGLRPHETTEVWAGLMRTAQTSPEADA